MLGTLMRFLPTLTQIFLWWAIFESARDGTIAKYSYNDMIAYYLMVTISRAFSSMPGLTTGIANQVRSGEIKKFMIQPVDMLGCLLVQRVAHKLVYYLIAALPFAFVFWLCGDFFVDGWPAADVTIVFFCSLILAFLLGFFMEACIGLVAFWFLEVTSLTFTFPRHCFWAKSKGLTCTLGWRYKLAGCCFSSPCQDCCGGVASDGIAGSEASDGNFLLESVFDVRP